MDKQHFAIDNRNIEHISKIPGHRYCCINALPYVKKWLASAHRGTHDNQTRKRQPKEDLRYSHIYKIFA